MTDPNTGLYELIAGALRGDGFVGVDIGYLGGGTRGVTLSWGDNQEAYYLITAHDGDVIVGYYPDAAADEPQSYLTIDAAWDDDEKVATVRCYIWAVTEDTCEMRPYDELCGKPRTAIAWDEDGMPRPGCGDCAAMTAINIPGDVKHEGTGPAWGTWPRADAARAAMAAGARRISEIPKLDPAVDSCGRCTNVAAVRVVEAFYCSECFEPGYVPDGALVHVVTEDVSAVVEATQGMASWVEEDTSKDLSEAVECFYYHLAHACGLAVIPGGEGPDRTTVCGQCGTAFRTVEPMAYQNGRPDGDTCAACVALPIKRAAFQSALSDLSCAHGDTGEFLKATGAECYAHMLGEFRRAWAAINHGGPCVPYDDGSDSRVCEHCGQPTGDGQ